MGRLIKIALALLVAHAGWRAGQAYWTHYSLEDDLKQLALFSGQESADTIRTRALEFAQHEDVPLDPSRLTVRKQGTHIIIDAAYVRDIEVVPRYFYPWEFKLSVEGWSGEAFERR